MVRDHSKGLIYVRYSPKPDDSEGDDADSLQYQEDYVRKYFAYLGIAAGDVIADPLTSARKVPLKERKGGKRLLALTTGRRPQYSVVGVYRLDRLFRNVVDGNLVLDAWRQAGTECHFAAEGGQSLNTASATGRFLVNVLLAKSLYEPDLTSERTSDAMRRHMRSGRVMGSQLPYGQQETQPDAEGRRMMEPCPAEVEIIAKIQAMYKLGLKPNKIADMLNANGVPCRGNKWHHPMVTRICRRKETP